ncbi:conserved hypothetical protein [Xanthobacter versatilis]|uniref:Lipase n=1 Tax=Xanthobacter autotrophicus (strain ATCC BAA-1158 / Py2) TaxID=78245 RepID=A7IPK9_XANP2|nr:conserved hypothetical protein [Xanthobacter autotrophicus Py2]
MTVDGHHRIFLRELKRFGTVWRAATRCRDAAPVKTPTGAFWQSEAEGPGWHTATTFEILAWDDLARADMGRPVRSHLCGSLRAIVDMVTSGTLLAYFRTSRRYGFFFLFTYLLLLAFWAAAVAVGFVVAHTLAPYLGAVAAGLCGVMAALACGLLLMRWPGWRFRLRQSLDLAEFSVDFARGRHPEVDARVAAFAGRLRAVEAAAGREGADETGVDEIVIAGHSLGAMHAVSTVAAALDQDPDFGTRVRVRILTLGSTTAKFALHPAGARLRAAAQRVADAPQIGWVEVQSRDDIVSFYKVNPVTLERATFAEPQLAVGDFTQRPLLRHVPVRDMVSAATYRRFFFDVMRRHCQCFLASDIRAPHDFYAYVGGPFAFDVLAAHLHALCAYMAPDGTPLPAAIDADGRLMALPEHGRS